MSQNKNKASGSLEWKPFLKQLMIASTTWTMYFCLGMQFGTITVMVPQLRRDNIFVSDEMASWLSSALGYAAIPWIVILNILAHNIGRKKTCIFIFFATITSNIGFYFSTTPTHLLISEILFSIPFAAASSISVIILAEYASPKYRGIFLCIKSASFFWGVWVANAIGTFTFWRCITIVSFVVSFQTLTVFFWPESPYWLASKNKLVECRKAHRWLNGKSENTELELCKLIQLQSELIDEGFRTIKSLKLMSRKDFYLPLLLSMLSILSYHVSGKLAITAYAVDMIKKMIKNESTVYYTMLILDGITVLSAYFGCYIAKLYKRRTIWFTTVTIAISFLLTLSLYTYLVRLSICSENLYLSICLLSGFSLSISCGPIILGTSFIGELLPYKYKSVTAIIVAIWNSIVQSSILKLTPVIVNTFSLHGTFLFYALFSGVCTCLMYFYLPEMKDKTLLEIEEHFVDRKPHGEGKNLVA